MHLQQDNENPFILGWDGDQTIWAWLKYAPKAYAAMAEAIAKYSGRKFVEVAAAMQVFYTRRETLEDEGLVQGLEEDGFFAHMRNFDRVSAIGTAQTAFDGIRSEKMEVYPGIAELIEEAHAAKIPQVLISDAPRVQAIIRLRLSGLEKFFDAAYTMPAAKVNGLRRRPKVSRSKDEPKSAPQKRPKYHSLPKEKPHFELHELLNVTRDKVRDRMIYVGDNVNKDMALVRAAGCTGIHAKYGAALPEELEAIRQFTPLTVARRHMQIPSSGGTTESFDESRIYVAERSEQVAKFVRQIMEAGQR